MSFIVRVISRGSDEPKLIMVFCGRLANARALKRPNLVSSNEPTKLSTTATCRALDKPNRLDPGVIVLVIPILGTPKTSDKTFSTSVRVLASRKRWTVSA
jgi:hypothetical protein